MAVSPVFLPDTDTLKSELRLSAVGTAKDAQQIIERAMARFRVELYRRVGLSRMTTLIALPVVENPTTLNGLLRVAAESLEVKWVRVLLMDTLPTLFMDDSGGAQEVYNDEGAFRKTDAEDRAALRKTSMSEIEELIEFLQTGELGENTTIQAYVSAARATIIPGDSAFPDQTRAVNRIFPHRRIDDCGDLTRERIEDD